ncbi:TerD family protein [Paenibacillus kobensis]|uniref:TerD family protein n=1 Tax=Paenibacillus kobensis TaxID=59841 RepID=UPI0013E3070C|nr:TerD family protein [Paenibacillus kobensis]
MDFVAIDFETANSNRSSACSVGLVEIRGGMIVNNQSWLIDPEQHFDSLNIGIHGITPAMVRGKPTFQKLWPTIRPMLEGKRVIAHNASFDMSVLRYCLDRYAIPYPTLEYYCTYLLSKKLLPDLPAYRLNDLAKLHFIPLNHHDALDDAKACAILMINFLHNNQLSDPASLSISYGFKIGRMHTGGYTPFSAPAANKVKKEQSAIQTDMTPDTAMVIASPIPALPDPVQPTQQPHPSIRLIRGHKIDVTKTINMPKLLVHLEWDSLNPDLDIDSSAFLLNAHGICSKDDDCIFYGNPDNRDGSVAYTKLNSNMSQFIIAFDRIALVTQKIAFALTIYEGEEQGHHFNQVSEIRILLRNFHTGHEIASYSFGEDLTRETAIVAGELYVYKGEWKFNPIGNGYFGGLRALCLDYGLEVVDTLPEAAADAQTIPSKETYDYHDAYIIGLNVERIRRTLGITQKHLAEKLGYKSANPISRLERGELERFTHAQLVNLADKLQVPTRQLLTK